MNGWISATSQKAEVTVDPAIGNIRKLVFHDRERELTPLATAPWVEEQDLPQTLAPVERSLSGDFLCAPFGRSDVEPGPIHGFTANSLWLTKSPAEPNNRLELELQRKVFGATVTKDIWLSDDAPLMYQQHRFLGGDGGITLAHHPMVKLNGRGRFCCSPKQIAIAAETPLEPERNRLAAGGESTVLRNFPASEGGAIDLTDLPIGDRHEDFVTLVEEAGRKLAWSAVLRDQEDDIVFFLKDPSVLPVTMLWHSNAGRDYAPWNGRHHGVIGIEDGCAAGALGHRAALRANRFSAHGIATAIELGDEIRIGHVTGGLARPSGCTEITEISLANGILTLNANIGVIAEFPFDESVFER